MNAQKMARLEGGLNGLAKKVLAAVPMQEAWSAQKISTELRRSGGSYDLSVITGCLNTLADSGIIKEPATGSFIRPAVRESITTTKEEAPMATNVRTIAPAEPEQDSMTRFANVAKGLRRLADEVELIALADAERTQKAEKDTENLRQLQALLKTIGQ